MSVRRALISGASIAGPVLAFWLAEAGWEVTVVERAPGLRTGGYPVDICGTAVDVIVRMGLYDRIVAHRYEHVPIVILSPRGCRIGTLTLGQLANEARRGDVEITRGALAEILYQASRDRACYVFGESITSLTETDGGVEATFQDESPRTFDIVIGADGMHSNVRRLVFGDESHFIRHLGPYAAVWDLPGSETFAAGEGYVYSHPGRSVMVERPADGAHPRAFLAFRHSAPGAVNRHDTDEIMGAIRDTFAEDRWRSREIIDTMATAEDLYFDTVSQIRMNCWSCGQVCLVGDAAHAPAFLSGRGTSVAIAGAYVLASELANTDPPELAFVTYERRMRGYVEQNQDLALRSDSTVMSHTKKPLPQRNCALSLVPWLQRRGFLKLPHDRLRFAATDLPLRSGDLRRRALLTARPQARTSWQSPVSCLSRIYTNLSR